MSCLIKFTISYQFKLLGPVAIYHALPLFDVYNFYFYFFWHEGRGSCNFCIEESIDSSKHSSFFKHIPSWAFRDLG